MLPTTRQPLRLDQALPTGGPPPDAALLARLRALAEAHLSEPELCPLRLATAANLSERTLYRRLRELTGYTPAGFVRELRLLRAQQLLREGALPTVASVAHAVGFVNAAHFGRSYLRRFGHPPSRRR